MSINTVLEVSKGSLPVIQSKDNSFKTVPERVSYPKMLWVGSLLRTWTEVSRINYTSMMPLEVLQSGQSLRRKVIGLKNTDFSLQCLVPSEFRTRSQEELFAEQFPMNVTSLMNEDQLWGCFYVFPELYADVYSPIVRVKSAEDVPPLVGGVLTRDMVTACLSYLKRIPILNDFVYIKLDLSMKDLTNIQVLQHYKFLVYLDLSTNYLTDLSVLSNLLYLQYLSVAFNRLESVLDYDTPQWFLSEVHYKYNLVTHIRDLSLLWSIVILDLSHNNIKTISGLENLMHLRRLDLSFNQISRLENLDHLRLLWLDVSYNRISCFQFGPDTGLRTLLHLEYLNLSDNHLASMKMFAGCTRLRELNASNNKLSSLLELSLYMRQLCRLVILDLCSNPVCGQPGYKCVCITTFPALMCLDSAELDPVEQRSVKLETSPDMVTFATRRLLRLMYVEQLRRARVSPFNPPGDTTEPPLVVLVGQEAVGKGSLARRLAAECSAHVEVAHLHTTASHHYSGHYMQVTRSKFDDMLLNGDFLTYSEINGESYGLSREESEARRRGRVRVACLDLPAALMLQLRGRRPYLIIATCLDKCSLAERQMDRKTARVSGTDARASRDTAGERSALQALLSGRIMVAGIINEIILCLTDEKSRSAFQIESQCSLMQDSEHRHDIPKDVNFLTISTSSTSLFDVGRQMLKKTSENDSSFCSLYKESVCTDEYTGEATHSARERKKLESFQRGSERISFPKAVSKKRGILSQKTRDSKSVDFSKSSMSKALPETKSKSVSIFPYIQNTEAGERTETADPLLLESNEGLHIESSSSFSEAKCEAAPEDMDMWLAFLVDNGLILPGDDVYFDDENARHASKKLNYFCKKGHPDFLRKSPYESLTSSTRDVYETIHRNRPGLFWDTVTMDNPEKAFKKAKSIIRNIGNSQPLLKPMFELDFAEDAAYRNARERLDHIRQQIAPRQLFH